MKLNETKKVDTNLYELNITVDGEQYAKALDALQPQRLFIAPRGMATTIFYTNFTGFDRLSSNDIIWYNWFKLEKCPAITAPAFDLWGQRWSRDIRIRGYGARPTATGAMFRSLAKSDDAEDAVQDCFME